MNPLSQVRYQSTVIPKRHSKPHSHHMAAFPIQHKHQVCRVRNQHDTQATMQWSQVCGGATSTLQCDLRTFECNAKAHAMHVNIRCMPLHQNITEHCQQASLITLMQCQCLPLNKRSSDQHKGCSSGDHMQPWRPAHAHESLLSFHSITVLQSHPFPQARPNVPHHQTVSRTQTKHGA